MFSVRPCTRSLLLDSRPINANAWIGGLSRLTYEPLGLAWLPKLWIIIITMYLLEMDFAHVQTCIQVDKGFKRKSLPILKEQNGKNICRHKNHKRE